MKLLGSLIVAIIVSFCTMSQASAETRSLKLYFIHTKERAEIVYKRNGRYDQRGLKEINRFLRDWRRNEPANMDPRLLDLVWEVYRSVGARDHIHVVSAYRSPATNASLRKRSSGVAEKSQHMLGKAMDFYIPGVPLSRLRAAAFKAHGGGVGYYPKSGAPFVHLDVGNVRSWPRMNRNELMALFPDGKTMHLPSDGKPLPGYNQALAAYQSRQRSGASVQIASASSGSSSRSGGFLANLLRGGGGADEEEDIEVAAAPTPAPVRQRQPEVQPEPQRQERGTILAALPDRNAPLPGIAPRPIVDIGAPAAAPLIAGLPAQTAPAPVAMAPIEMAALPSQVPLPAQRPDLAPAVQVEAASTDLPVSAIAPERPKRGGSEAISDMLALSAAEARADVVINPPVPALRPLGAQQAGDVTQVAAISSDEGGDVFVLAALPDASAPASRNAIADAMVERTAPFPPQDDRLTSLSASPRVAMLSRKEGSDAAAALDSGVRTTGKSAKPRADEARNEPKPVVMPVQRELTRWAFQSDVTVANAGGINQRSAAHEVVWSAPRTVYTDGFKRGAAPTDVNRFTGNAVTFLSVARFEDNN